jgi:hypothetical protein
LEKQRTVGRMTLKLILENIGMGLILTGYKQGTVSGFCKHKNKYQGFIKLE